VLAPSPYRASAFAGKLQQDRPSRQVGLEFSFSAGSEPLKIKFEVKRLAHCWFTAAPSIPTPKYFHFPEFRDHSIEHLEMLGNDESPNFWPLTDFGKSFRKKGKAFAYFNYFFTYFTRGIWLV